MFKVAGRVNKAEYAIRDPEIAAKVSEMKKKGRDIVEINIGDPGAKKGAYGFSMPKYIKQELTALINKGGEYDGYANEQGELDLRNAVAEDSKKQGIADANPENVIVTNGLSEFIDYLFGVSVEKGLNVVLPRPDYSLYTARVRWYDGETRYYDMDSKNDWQPKVEEIEDKIDENTVAVALINPSNPTGGIFERESLKALIDIVQDKGHGEVPIISDEVYHTLRFDGGKHTATASLTTEVPVITLDGFSKGYYSPGWRLGTALFSNFKDMGVFKALVKVCGFRLCANNAAQHAYAKGISDRDKPENKAEFDKFLGMLKERAEYATKRLNSITGISCIAPRGAFYAFPKVEKGNWKTDKQFVLDLLEEEGVRVVPGSGFEMKPEEMFFRVVTLPDVNNQKEAYDRLERFMRKRLG